MRWIALNASVGTASAKNESRDVKIAQALLNVYLRNKKKIALGITGKINDETNKAILDFQSNYLKISKPDGRIDRGGMTYRGLVENLKKSFTVQAIVPPTFGIVTWESEGAEGGIFHSRKLHVPSNSSGLTIGRGYDFRQKNQTTVISDLTSAGMNVKYIQILKKAVGFYGNSAQQFIIDNDLLDFEIPPEVQKKLFKISYENEANEVKRICNLKRVVNEYGETDWVKLDKNIKDITVDLKFRGDYTEKTRKFLQNSIANNDLASFKKEIMSKNNWTKVPEDRFARRKKFIEKKEISNKKAA